MLKITRLPNKSIFNKNNNSKPVFKKNNSNNKSDKFRNSSDEMEYSKKTENLKSKKLLISQKLSKLE